MDDTSIPDLSPEERKKALARAADKRYRARHPERLRARAQQRWQDPEKRERKRTYNKAYRATKQGQEVLAAWNSRNIDKTRASCRGYMQRKRANDPEGMRAYERALYAANPEHYAAMHKVHNDRRRAHKANAPINDFTRAQWRDLLKAVGYRCAYCGKKFKAKELTEDHITPLSKGGAHTLSNIIPACQRCNSRKKDGEVLVPVQPFLLIR